MACSIANRAARFAALALLLLPSAASAQVSAADAQTAQQLFDQGRALMEKGKFSQACPLFAESQRLDPGGGTLANLALCHEKEGRLALALTEFEAALAQAIKDKRRDREAIARERIAAIGVKVPRLLITIAPGADLPGLVVKLDGEELKREQLGTTLTVDPGVHRIDVSAPGRKSGTFVIPIGESTTKPFEIPALAEDGSGAVVGCPPGSEWTGRICQPVQAHPVPPPPPPVEPAPQQPAEITRQSPWFYASLGLAIAAGGTSIVTGLMALSAQDSYKSKCVANRSFCPDPSGADDAARAKDLAWVSTITLGVALVSGIVAIALPKEHVAPEKPKAGITVVPAVSGVSGTF